jgi:hypothetical protein
VLGAGWSEPDPPADGDTPRSGWREPDPRAADDSACPGPVEPDAGRPDPDADAGASTLDPGAAGPPACGEPTAEAAGCGAAGSPEAAGSVRGRLLSVAPRPGEGEPAPTPLPRSPACARPRSSSLGSVVTRCQSSTISNGRWTTEWGWWVGTAWGSSVGSRTTTRRPLKRARTSSMACLRRMAGSSMTTASMSSAGRAVQAWTVRSSVTRPVPWSRARRARPSDGSRRRITTWRVMPPTWRRLRRCA